MKQGDITEQEDITVCDPFQEYQPASEMHKRMIAAIIFSERFWYVVIWHYICGIL